MVVFFILIVFAVVGYMVWKSSKEKEEREKREADYKRQAEALARYGAKCDECNLYTKIKTEKEKFFFTCDYYTHKRKPIEGVCRWYQGSISDYKCQKCNEITTILKYDDRDFVCQNCDEKFSYSYFK